MMNTSIFGCLIVYLLLKFLPLDLITVVLIWVCTLRNSEFFSNLFVAICKRLKRVDTNKLRKNYIVKYTKTKDYIFDKAEKMTKFALEIYEWPIGPTLRFICSILVCLQWIIMFIFQKLKIRRRRLQLGGGGDGEN